MGSLWGKKQNRPSESKIGDIFKPASGQLILCGRALADQDLHYVFANDLKSVTRINLSSNLISGSEPMFDCILQSPMVNLQVLNLQKNQLCDQGFKELCRGDWPSLTILILNYNHLTSKGLQNLRKSCFRQLFSLYLQDNSIGSLGVLELTKCPFSHLANLIRNLLDDKSMMFLKDGYFPKLQQLNLAQNNDISYVGVITLLQGSWDQLKELRLWNKMLDKDQRTDLSNYVELRLKPSAFHDL